MMMGNSNTREDLDRTVQQIHRLSVLSKTELELDIIVVCLINNLSITMKYSVQKLISVHRDQVKSWCPLTFNDDVQAAASAPLMPISCESTWGDAIGKLLFTVEF